MPSNGMERPEPNDGDPDDRLVDLTYQLAPRGHVGLIPEDWAVAAQEMNLRPLPVPALPGLWQQDRSPQELDREQHRAWKNAAQKVADRRVLAQHLVTSSNVGVRNGR